MEGTALGLICPWDSRDVVRRQVRGVHAFKDVRHGEVVVVIVDAHVLEPLCICVAMSAATYMCIIMVGRGSASLTAEQTVPKQPTPTLQPCNGAAAERCTCTHAVSMAVGESHKQTRVCLTVKLGLRPNFSHRLRACC